MTLDAFRKKYLGKRISGYSTSGGQCVDECRQWMAEGFGWSRSKIYKAVPPGNANTWWKRASTTYFTKVAYKAGRIPPKNAIVCMNTGTYGHVFIAKKDSTKDRIRSLDQNWSISRKVTDEAHRYVGVQGWLIRK